MRSMGDLHQYGKRTIAEAHMADTGPAQQPKQARMKPYRSASMRFCGPGGGRWRRQNRAESAGPGIVTS